ncbi:MAG: AI-2E family transporter [Chloroflexi bacterium]|nr:AI-2E family transporter [Chloroflexota bacterium]
MTKQLFIFATAIMTTLLAMAALWQFRMAAGYVLISLACAAAVRPVILFLAGRSFAKRLILLIFFAIGLGGLGFLIYLAAKSAAGEVQQLAQALSTQAAWNLPAWLAGSSLEKTLAAWVPTPGRIFEMVITGEQGQLVLPAVFNLTQGLGGILSGTLLVFFLSIYWSLNQIHFERLWLSLLSSDQRRQARDIWRAIELDLGAYIRSEIIQSLLAALLLGLGYWMLGSPYPALLALIGALAWLVPVVGIFLAVFPPIFMGMLTGLQVSIFTTIYTVIVLAGLQVWLEPRLFRRKWDNPVLTLVILLALADAFGLPGILIAPPLSAICQIVWSFQFSNRMASGAATRISDLKERQTGLWVAIGEMDSEPPPSLISGMERLTHLLEKAEPILPVTDPLKTIGGLPSP